MARLADTAFGRILRDHAQAEGIDLHAAPSAAEPATLAVVSLDAQARASYDFYLNGTADWQWTAGETGRTPAENAILHFGSIASWTPPGDAEIGNLARRLRERGDVLISYDPNVRPGLLADPGHGREVAERAIGLAHLAKASSDDIAWLYPELSPADVAQRWLELGATVVVITSSADGAYAYTAHGSPVRRPALDVTVVDTVGAGDSFTAGLIGSLLSRGQYAPGELARCPGPADRGPGRRDPGGLAQLRAAGQRPAHRRRRGRGPGAAQAHLSTESAGRVGGSRIRMNAKALTMIMGRNAPYLAKTARDHGTARAEAVS
jgi:fructokinase